MVSATGRLNAPMDLVLRQFRARYDREWHPLELTVDATARGVPSFLSVTVSGTSAAIEIAGPPGTERVRRTEQVDPQVAGTGHRHAVAELLTCPFCMAQWTATGLVAGHVLAPRFTRLLTATFAAVAGADALQYAYAALAGTQKH